MTLVRGSLLHGSYPTPVERLAKLSTAENEVWVKRDDLTHPTYGGNKVRKLEHLLLDAQKRGKKRLVTIGAAGSHHVLATTIFARAAGFDVDAVLVPQRSTAHVVANLRADLAQGVTPFIAGSYVGGALRLVSRWGRDAYMIPMGGSNVVGSLGYVDAAFELEKQVRAGEMPEPDCIVITVGSGGTAAGLCAGLALTSLQKTRVLGVMVAPPASIVRGMVRWLVARTHRAAGGKNPSDALARLDLTTSYMGRGYGEPTEKGAHAEEWAATVGLALDPTYTAKTFAAVLDEVEQKRHRCILYWHTLSSAPMGPLLRAAPPLPERFQALCK